MTPLPLPTFIPRYSPPKHGKDRLGYLAFGHDLVNALCPSVYVCLVAGSEDAYFGICQTVLERGLDCVCYGALPSGDVPQPSDVDRLASYNEHHYRGFSRLLNDEEELKQHFSDGSIAVLQIGNGRDVTQTFEGWWPKVKAGGVILVEGIAERNAEGRAWRLWEQIESSYSECFAFHDAGGLGVLRKPGAGGSASPFMDGLFNSSGEERECIRRHYVLYGGYLDSVLRRDRATDSSDRKASEAITELRAAQHERMILEAELAQVQLELTRALYEQSEEKRKAEALQESIAAAAAAHDATRLQMQQVSQALQAEQQLKRELLDSFSWKVTAPVREFMEWTRRRKAK